jgi:hypothetical protein
MAETFKLNLIKKDIDKSAEYGVPVKETRWFVETNDGFDGTAQGYGFKTPQAVYKAYAYFKSKGKRQTEASRMKQFLKDNPDIKAALKNYLDADWAMDRYKDGEPTSIENMLEYIAEDQPEVVQKLNDNKSIWKALMKFALDN